MTTQIQRRRGTTAQHSTFTGAEAELTVDTTKDTVVVHDGSTVGGRPLLREDQSNLPTSAPTTGIYNASGALAISTGGSGRLFVDANGNVSIGSSGSPYAAANRGVLEVNGTNQALYGFKVNTAGVGYLLHTGTDLITANTVSAGAVTFSTNGSDRARIDSSGRLLVGTSTTSGVARTVIQGYVGDNNGLGLLQLQVGSTSPGFTLGRIDFTDSNSNAGARFLAERDGGTWTSGSSHPTRLVFSTTADGASSPTERMRITQGGTILIGKTTNDQGNAGMQLIAGGRASFATDGSECIYVNRNTNDGNLIELAQAGTIEGTISVSGTTVSYNGAHLSRWSQLPSGAEREEILRGSVLSNIDEMCEWGDEENEQLNRMKVSDVEGDKNVSGVFQAWDDDDDTYTNDFYCAMTGDFIIRIGAGVTVERGDLLMSAGDGTAKPQADDLVRSCTIAKVTSTNVSCTYDDGSYCVPCVLMAC